MTFIEPTVTAFSFFVIAILSVANHGNQVKMNFREIINGRLKEFSYESKPSHADLPKQTTAAHEAQIEPASEEPETITNQQILQPQPVVFAEMLETTTLGTLEDVSSAAMLNVPQLKDFLILEILICSIALSSVWGD
jgi:hypothetical protein